MNVFRNLRMFGQSWEKISFLFKKNILNLLKDSQMLVRMIDKTDPIQQVILPKKYRQYNASEQKIDLHFKRKCKA